MNLIKEIFSGSKSFHAAIFLASVLFLYLFSYSTSPLYNSLGDDSAIFQAVGKGWSEGHLPYVDLFENKGPLIFFIDAIGYMIYPRVGIFVLQLPAMYLSFLLAWRSLSLYLSCKARVAAMVFTLVYYALYFLDGNRTEEWSMPFLMAATYFFLRGLKEERFSCPPLVGLINGLGFGACVLLRTTNAAPLCCCTLLSALFLIQARDFKALWQNVLNFCAGFVIICLPFVVYFAARGALYDMLYGTILLNMTYTTNSSHYPLNEFLFFYVVANFAPLILLTIISFAGLRQDKSKLMLSGLFIGWVILIFMIKLRPYVGYCALIVPTISILFIVADRVIKFYYEPLIKILQEKTFSFKRLATKAFVVLLMSIGLFYLWGYTLMLVGIFKNIYNEEFFAKEEPAKFFQLKELIPESEQNSFVTWGRSGFVARWILITEINSRERFFGYIKSFGDVDPSIRKGWFKSVKENPPLWVLYCWKKNELYTIDKDSVELKFLSNKDAELEKFLQEKYTLKRLDDISSYIVKLYRLKD